MSLLAGSVVENSDCLAGSDFVLLKKRPGRNMKVFRHNFSPQGKD